MPRQTPVPPEFKAEFVAHGWRHVEHMYGARTDTIRKWQGLVGGLPYLKIIRKEYLRSVKDESYSPADFADKWEQGGLQGVTEYYAAPEVIIQRWVNLMTNGIGRRTFELPAVRRGKGEG